MDAADLHFAPETFNTVICTEAAFHFRTRRDFFSEAFRVLKPGGFLLLADIIFGTDNDVSDFIIPGANTVADIDDYREQLAEAGFEFIRVIDATLECWIRYTQNLKRWLMVKQIAGELLPEDRERLRQNPFTVVADYWYYLLAAAQKPA
jgi:SAM-dependent methyltransferase